MPGVALIILAAGNSSRLGQAKQLKLLNGKTLLERIFDAGEASECSELIVVLGFDLEQMANAIRDRKAIIARNESWETGMGSSIAAGIRKISELELDVEAAIVSVCDQPYSNTELFNKMIATFKANRKNIVACQYDGIIGTPALFPARCFSRLAQLQGHEGGRKLLRDPAEKVTAIDFPKGSIDIDTEEDWQTLLQSKDPPVVG